MSTDPCSKHTLLTQVTLDHTKLKFQQDDALVAALLRTCAAYTDGPCAIRHATDASLTRPYSRLKFWFSDKAHQDVFPVDVRNLLSAQLQSAIKII